MQKKFLSNLFITLITNLLVKPFWIFGIDRSFQNRLGLENYGVYTNLFTFSIILGLLLDFGINNYNSSSLARNEGLLKQQFAPLLMLKVILSIAYVFLTILLGFIYGFNQTQLYVLFILCINQCLAYASTYFRSTLTGLQFYKKDALISVTDKLVMVISGSALLLFNLFPISILSFVYIQTIGYATAMVISFVVLLPQLSGISFQLNLTNIKPIFQKSLPYATLALLMMLYSKLDIIGIKKFVPNGDIENGIYAQSLRLFDAFNMLAVLVSGLLLPMFSSMIKQKQLLTPMVKLAMLVLIVPAIVGLVFCCNYGQEIMSFLYHDFNLYHTKVFVFTIISVLPICFNYIFGTLLTAKGHIQLLIKIAFIALVFNMMANILMIPQYGALGAAVVAVFTHLIVAVLGIYFVLTKMQINMSIAYFLKFPVFAFLSFGSLFLLKSYNLPIVLLLLLYLLIVVFFIFIIRITEVATIRKAIKQLRL